MKKKAVNYGIALLVFIVLMILINGGSAVISFGALIGGGILDSSDGLNRAYYFLMDHLNFSSILMYMIPAAVILPWYYFAFVENGGMKKFWKEQTAEMQPVHFVWLILLGVAVQHAAGLVMTGIGFILPSAMESYTELVESSGMTQYSVLWAVSTLILPPLVEETAFRGLMFRYLKKAGAGFILANLIQSVCFGIFHMNLVQGIYASMLGFLLGYLTQRYNSLLAPVIFHGLFNLFGTALVDFENRFLPEPVIGMLIFGSVPVLAVILVMIHYRIGEKKKKAGWEDTEI